MQERQHLFALNFCPIPQPQAQQLLLRVGACGVCRTDLHILDGELTEPVLPLIPGHEIVGVVVQVGAAVQPFRVGRRVGVPWLGYACGQCRTNTGAEGISLLH